MGVIKSETTNSFIKALLLPLAIVCMMLNIATPSTARFLQPDTWNPWLAGVDNNRYGYAGDDPISGSDPNGHNWASPTSAQDVFDDIFCGPSCQGHVDPQAMTSQTAIATAKGVGKGAAIGLGIAGAGAFAFAAPEVIGPAALRQAFRQVLNNLKNRSEPTLTPAQAANLERFKDKLPAVLKNDVKVTKLSNGWVKFEVDVPGKVPGSYANYAKIVDQNGTTVSMPKTVYDPKGNVVHVKEKIVGPNSQNGTGSTSSGNKNSGGSSVGSSGGGGLLGFLKSVLGF